MNIADTFFLIVFATVLITRIFLFIHPTPSPRVGPLRLHHWMFGLILIPLGIFLNSLLVYGIGVGLFIDELTFVLMGGKSHEENYLPISFVGTAFFVLLAFILRGYLLTPFT